jgi:hypothetical protein
VNEENSERDGARRRKRRERSSRVNSVEVGYESRGSRHVATSLLCTLRTVDKTEGLKNRKGRRFPTPKPHVVGSEKQDGARERRKGSVFQTSSDAFDRRTST